MTTKHLGELNSMRFFCQCGMGEEGNCPNFHPSQIHTPGSRQRHILILSAIAAIGLMVLVVGFWNAS